MDQDNRLDCHNTTKFRMSYKNLIYRIKHSRFIFIIDGVSNDSIKNKKSFIKAVVTDSLEYLGEVDRDEQLFLVDYKSIALRSDPPVADLNVRAGRLRQLARQSKWLSL